MFKSNGYISHPLQKHQKLEKEYNKKCSLLEGVEDCLPSNKRALIEAEKVETTYALIKLDQVDCKNCYEMFKRVVTVVFHFKQLRNFQKLAKQRRWNQTTIRFCIILQGRSFSNYEFIRVSETMILPSRNTLQAYTGKCRGQVGVLSLAIQLITMQTKEMGPK